MTNINFKQHIENLFKNSQKFSDIDKNLNISMILESIEKIDIELIKILKDDEKAKKEFFTQIDDIYILNQNKLIEFFTLNDYMKNGSYTAYTNKIGLIKKDSFIKKFDDVVLAFPHKDCVLEGGQTKEDDKNKEIFYNQILSSDEIDRLFEPKVLTNIKRYSKDGIEENPMIKNDDNLIIKGNNLIALHSLKKKFAGRTKLICIDPPYNTGNDSFKYNDNFNHSTWLTFMKNRLEIAREFLSDDGVIFISCDDNEQAYLKVLMNEVFGRDNFIADVIWEKADSPRMDAQLFSNRHDYIIVFSKQIQKVEFHRLKTSEEKLKHYNKIDSDGKRYYLKPLRAMGGQGDSREARPSLYYPLISPDGGEVYPKKQDGTDGAWRWNKNKVEKEKDRIEWIKTKNGWSANTKLYLDKSTGRPAETIWFSSEVGTNRTSKREIKDIFGFNLFDTPKPEYLLKRIIEISTNPNDLIMDYHLILNFPKSTINYINYKLSA